MCSAGVTRSVSELLGSCQVPSGWKLERRALPRRHRSLWMLSLVALLAEHCERRDFDLPLLFS